MLILENLFTDLSIFVNFPLSEKFWPMAELGVNIVQLQLGLYAAWLSLAVRASGRLPVANSMLERGGTNSISINFYE